MLVVESTGAGPDLVLLHGWGSNLAVWMPLAGSLRTSFRVHAVDLPGYGESPACYPWSLDEVASLLHARFGPEVAVCGWSLGGLVALEWVRRAGIRRLVLVGATPCFARRGDWPHGMEEALLAQFHDQLVTDFDGTLGRFIALQSLGAAEARTTARFLTDTLHARGRPVPAVLEAGLAVLAETDLRAALPDVAPLVIHGDRDRIAPPGAARWLAERMRGALRMVAGAGHAPFLSHPQEVADAMREFLLA